MELALTLGVDPSKPFSDCMELALDLGGASAKPGELDDDDGDDEKEDEEEDKHAGTRSSSSSSDHHHHHPLQLELLPLSPVPRPHQISSQIRFPWLPSSDISGASKLNAARATSLDEQSSPNSAGSSLMEFSLYRHAGVASGGGKRAEPSLERAEVASDDENGSTRKKLRLSKEQSAFLEESFKEHHTLNPKQKLALAKQLSLRPRQVEVWFQNRRARTKLKQTEVDCEYLKRCCETLTEENRRLQKELHELRALKSSQPFYMQLPATTLTMCPSCERVAPTTKAAGNPQSANPKPILPFVGPPQAQSQAHPFVGPPQAQSQAHKAVS